MEQIEDWVGDRLPVYLIPAAAVAIGSPYNNDKMTISS
jgi:hypothetical protein